MATLSWYSFDKSRYFVVEMEAAVKINGHTTIDAKTRKKNELGLDNFVEKPQNSDSMYLLFKKQKRR